MNVLDLDNLKLARGGHSVAEGELCLMEAVARDAGEPHSDHPQCASPVLGSFGRVLNDGMNNEYRQKLIQFVVPLAASRNDAIEQARGEYLLNAGLNVLIPIGLRNWADRVGAKDEELAERFRGHARQFEELPKIKYSSARDLALALARDLDLALALARDLARALALDRAHARALDRALDLALALARRDLALARRDLALDLALALARRDLALDLALPPADPTKVWDAAIEIFGKALAMKSEEVAA